MPKPRISLVHSSARPEQWFETCTQWFNCCDNLDSVEYCLCYESEKGNYGLERGPWKDFKATRNSGRPCLVDGWNTAAALATGQLIVGIADDLLPTGPHWDTQLLEAVPPAVRESPYFIWPSTRSESDNYICIHPIMTRKYYEVFGYWFYPKYWAVFADNENWDIAQRDKAVYDVRDKVVFDHRHTTNQKREGDAVDTANLSRWYADEALYKARKDAGFPRDIVL